MARMLRLLVAAAAVLIFALSVQGMQTKVRRWVAAALALGVR
jgi:hypothetical protein